MGLLPGNVTHGTISGTLIAAEQVDAPNTDIDSTPIVGKVTFTPTPKRVLDPSAQRVILPRPVVVTLDATGAFTARLVATDNPAMNPVDWTYKVTFQLSGGLSLDPFDLSLPTGATLDLAAVVPVVSSGGTQTIQGPAGPEGPAGPPGPSTTLAWQFKVSDHGAVGDGMVVNDVATTSASANITSATANWTSADVGKWIMVNGGLDAAGGPLISTITAFVSATEVTLADNAARTATGLPAVWGTDDTAAINAAVTAAGDYALAGNYLAEVVFDAKTYVLAGAPTQAVSPQYNAQIPVPHPAVDGTSRKLVIGFKGAGASDHAQFWRSTTPNLAGTALVSVATAPAAADPTYGVQSVLGGPSAGGAFSGGFANTKVSVEDLMVVCPAFTNMTAFDFTWLGGMHIDRASAHIFAPPVQGPEPVLNTMVGLSFYQSRIGAGLRTPANGNNADNAAPSCVVEGFSRGVYFGDHATFGRLLTIYNDVAGIIDSTIGLSGVGHNVTIDNWSAEVYNGGLLVNGGYVQANITMASECISPVYDISDAANALHGEIWWSDPADARDPAVTGAANLTFHNNKKATTRLGGMLAPRVVSLTDTATIAVDASAANDFRVTLGGNRVLGTPTNPTDGQRITFHVTQDATGSRLLTYDTGYSFGSSAAPTLSTAAGKLDVLGFVYNAAKGKWLYTGSTGGF